MTRTQQWWQRRKRYILRHLRYTNAKTRPRKSGGGGDTFHKGGHQKALGVLSFGKQPFPRVKYKTYLAQRPTTFAYPGVAYRQIDGSGYADPPHWKIGPPPAFADGYHAQQAIGPGANRAVEALSRPRGRMVDKDVHSFRAWTFWKMRRVWPVWDPKGRTPVDPNGIGEDDDWTV